MNKTTQTAQNLNMERHNALQALLTKVPQQPQRQDSTLDQLKDLRAVANRFGMYDAADVLRLMIERHA